MAALRLLRLILNKFPKQASKESAPVRRPIGIESLESRELFAALPAARAAEVVYELNRIRVQPREYRHLLDSAWIANKPTPPLILNPALTRAAELHSAAMETADFFAHTDPRTGEFPNQRLRAQGYALADAYPDDANDVEIIAATRTADSSLEFLSSLMDENTDFSNTHRALLLGIGSKFNINKEIGIAYADLTSSSVDELWTIEVAHQTPTDRFIGGFVFDDLNNNLRYDAGEGIPNVIVSSGTLQTVTDSRGSYRLVVSSGLHDVQFLHPDGSVASEMAIVQTDNLQMDWPKKSEPQINFRSRSLWTNPLEFLDTNGDTSIQPLDALIVINHLNRNGIGPLAEIPPASSWNTIDVNGDGFSSPMDALLIINYLNRRDI